MLALGLNFIQIINFSFLNKNVFHFLCIVDFEITQAQKGRTNNIETLNNYKIEIKILAKSWVSLICLVTTRPRVQSDFPSISDDSK